MYLVKQQVKQTGNLTMDLINKTFDEISFFFSSFLLSKIY